MTVKTNSVWDSQPNLASRILGTMLGSILEKHSSRGLKKPSPFTKEGAPVTVLARQPRQPSKQIFMLSEAIYLSADDALIQI